MKSYVTSFYKGFLLLISSLFFILFSHSLSAQLDCSTNVSFTEDATLNEATGNITILGLDYSLEITYSGSDTDFDGQGTLVGANLQVGSWTDSWTITVTDCNGNPPTSPSLSLEINTGQMFQSTIWDWNGPQTPNSTVTMSGSSASFTMANSMSDLYTFTVKVCVPELNQVVAVCPLTVITYVPQSDIAAYEAEATDGDLNLGTSFEETIILDGNGNYFTPANNTCGEIENNIMDLDANGDGDLDDEGDIDADGDGNIDAGVTAMLSYFDPDCNLIVGESDCDFCDPPPPCTDCTVGESKFLNLQNTGSIPNPVAGGPDLKFGLVEIDNVCIGTYEFLYSDLDVNNDGSGTTFGGFDNDGGFMLLKVDFCTDVFVNQIDIVGLESESIVCIGTTATGTGAGAVIGGETISLCQNPSSLMEMMGTNCVFTNSPGCNANPNGAVEMGANVNTLYFSYQNPVGGCSFDYVGFKVSACYDPPTAAAIPVCPIQTYQVACYDPAGDPGSISNVLIDAAGNVFNGQSCLANIPAADGSGLVDLEFAVTNGIALMTANIGCAEIVELVGSECNFDACISVPECSTCPTGTEFSYISLDKTGTNPTTGLDIGIVELNKVCIGYYEFTFSDLDKYTDGNGSTFGGFDVDNGTMFLQIDFCESIEITELQIVGLEVESQVSVGTTFSGNGPTATLSGLSLTRCAGSTRMDLNDGAPNLVITDGPGCLANPNATYTISPSTINRLFFKYHNPLGGCSFDYVGFRVGACYSPPAPAIPVCPIQEFVIACLDIEGNMGPTNNVMIDANGNVFNAQSCMANVPAADGSGPVDLELAIEMGTSLETIDIGCAEIIEAIEPECNFENCISVPDCASCPLGEDFEYIRLNQTGMSSAGLDLGAINLNGIKIGTYEFIFSDLDVNTDGNGTTFGGFDNDGGTMVLQMDFCEPLNIVELEITGLEVESQVTIGNTITGTGASSILAGLNLTFCDGSDRMDANDITSGNTVTTAGPGCGANPDATYLVDPAMVSTLYFKYHNPAGGCSFDYVGFRVGACIGGELPMVIPQCPLITYEINDCPEDPTSATYNLLQDGNGNWYDITCPLMLPDMPVQSVGLSPCAEITMVEECEVCIIPGLAKTILNVDNSASGIAGNIDVTYKFTLTNYGGAEMVDLVIQDDLSSLAGFVSLVSGPTISLDEGSSAAVVNGSYAGTGNLLNGSSGSLNDGEFLCVEVVVEFDASEASSSDMNIAQGGGAASAGGMTSLDDSTNGINPDPDGDGDPSNDPIGSPLYFPSINLAKEYIDVQEASSGTLGNFDVTVQLVLENTGNVALSNLSLIDDLESELEGGFVELVTDPSLGSSTATTNPMFNGAYDGSATTNIFNGTSGTLEPGQSITITMVVEINPNSGTNFPANNQASTSGVAVDPVTGNPLLNSDGSTVMVMDDSDAGTDPDSQNGTNFGNTGGSNDPSILQLPSISLAKDFTEIMQTACRPAGNVDVTYQLYVMNTGNVNITDIDLMEELGMEFGTSFVSVETVMIESTTATSIPNLNSGFDGVGDVNLFDGNSGLLEPNQNVVLTLVVELDPNATGAPIIPFNQASVNGSSFDFQNTMVIVNDLSDSGSNPNSINDGEPNDSDVVGVSEIADDPTPFPLANINSAKELTNLSAGSVNGYIQATYLIHILNTGNVDLTGIELVDNFNAGNLFGSAFKSVSISPTIVESSASTNPFLNSNFNGATDSNILSAGSGVLAPGEGLTIQFTIEVDPSSNSSGFCNQALVSATGDGPNGDILISDLSDAGSNPESENNDSVQGGSICSDDCTLFDGSTSGTSCWDQACGALTCNDEINLSVGPQCEVFLSADMLIEGIDDSCLGYGFPSFFDIVVLDEDGNPLPTDATFGGILIDGASLIGRTISVSVSSLCNENTCLTEITFEDKIAPEPDCPCESPYLADGVTPNPDCVFYCYEVWDLEILEDKQKRNNEVLPDADEGAPVDNCIEFGEPRLITYEYIDGNCGEQIVRRKMAWDYTNADGSTQTIECVQNFLFDNLEVGNIGGTENGTWDGYENIFIANSGDRPMSDFYTPEPVINLSCGTDTDPASIAAFFDVDTPGRPVGVDRDDHDDTPNILEHNEGIPYAYPYVVIKGWSNRYHAKAIDNNVCNIYQGYTDLEYDACSDDCKGTRKVGRTWSILDWCTGTVIEFQQTIKVVDMEAPSISGLDQTVSVDPWNCTIDFEAPGPDHLHDNCDTNVSWYLSGPAGVIIQGNTAIDLPKGVTVLYYESVDCCGNLAKEPFTVTVVDNTPPTVVVKQNLVVQLTNIDLEVNTGIAKLYAVDVDNFSHDGCSDIHFEIRRPDDIGEWCALGSSTFNNDGHPGDDENDTDGGEYVKFCCEDVLQVDTLTGVSFGIVDVILRVWDDGDMDGVFGTEGDNYNESWATVRVEDKLAPVVICPPTAELACHEDYLDYDLTGRPYASKTCSSFACDEEPSDRFKKKPANSAPFLGEEIAAYNPSCRRGAIERTWNCGEYECTQWIIMRDTEDGPLDVTFPDDLTVNCMDTDPGTPSVVERLCELSGVSLESDTFNFEDGACFKILHHWTVINWCDYDANDSDLNDSVDQDDDGFVPGFYQHTQVVKLIDTEKPVLTAVDTCFAANTDCVGTGLEIWAGASDNGVCGSAWLKWEVEIDMWSDWEVDYSYSSFLASDDEFYVAPSSGDIHITLPDDLPMGCASNHRVLWTVHDGCGNTTSRTSFFTVEDKKKPTPYMLNLSTALMQNGQVELWARDFDAGSFDNCTDQGYLAYTFSSTVPPQLLDPTEEDPWYDVDGVAKESDYEKGEAEEWNASTLSSARIFDLDDLALAESNGGFLPLQVHVWDLCGNQDFAVVNLKLIFNEEGQERANIAGSITTEQGAGIENVKVTALSDQPGYPYVVSTDDEGSYMFEYNPMYEDYSLSGEKNDDWLNGVTTLDLVLIQRHVLGLQTLEGAYNIIAADANNDEKVSAIDLIHLRKLILGVYAELPNNDSWKFMDSDLTMNADNPWPFDESLTINDLASEMMTENFVGVKVGDVNGSVILGLTGNNVSSRNGKNLEININQIDLGQGERRLEFSSTNFNDLAGFQFTLEASATEITEVTSGAISLDDTQVSNINGALAFSWNSDKNVSTGTATLFSVTIKSNESGLRISDRVANSEAYVGDDLETINVVLAGEVLAVNKLGQNEPNPWRAQTTINFSLAESGEATITIYDVTGKTLMNSSADYSAGDHEFVIKDKVLAGASGVMYYMLQSGEFSSTKKMILIE